MMRTLIVSVVIAILTFANAGVGAPRLYTGSLVIQAFGNDTTTGTAPPYASEIAIGIPLGANCNTVPYHAQETVTVPTYPNATDVFTWTIPRYGGAVRDVDTNGDGVPDIVGGCGSATRRAGAPLVGSGSLVTTGNASTSRTSMNPRAVSIPQGAVSREVFGSTTDYGVYLFEVHYGDLQNQAGQFSKDGGDGDFSVAHPGKRKAVQTAGKNRFGGVMRLLGSYGSIEGYVYNNIYASVIRFDWLFDYLGRSGQFASPSGMVLAGYTKSVQNHGYSLLSGRPFTSTAYAEVFKWTTGTVSVTAREGIFPTVLRRKGFDARTPMGSGQIQLVSPMLTRWVGLTSVSTASIGVMTVNFVPEPSRWLLFGSGMFGLIALYRASRSPRGADS